MLLYKNTASAFQQRRCATAGIPEAEKLAKNILAYEVKLYFFMIPWRQEY